MGIIARVVAGGVIGAAGLAILWVIFFTFVVNWPAHESFTTVVFVLGGLAGTMLSVKGFLW